MKKIEDIMVFDGEDYVSINSLVCFPKLDYSKLTWRQFRKIFQSFAKKHGVFGRSFFKVKYVGECILMCEV